jgi:anhydro-N-acetylmuramic acid kinase
VPARNVAVLGCHGQTIYHESGRCTLQIGDGSVLAERTGVPVVSDFRPRDIAAGGEGAPLVPFVDFRLLAHRTKGRVALNIGGIANVTLLPAGCDAAHVAAFDTGPGNMAIDQLVAHFSQGKKRYDAGGQWAARGLVDPELLRSLLSDPYYSRRPPKTVGREQYGSEFVRRLLAAGLPEKDLIATATAFTAATVAEGVYQFARGTVDEVIVSGGGVHNEALMRYLRAEFPGVVVASSAEYGIDPDAKEAIAFAILAVETLKRRPSNLPSATGASHAAVLGKLSW